MHLGYHYVQTVELNCLINLNSEIKQKKIIIKIMSTTRDIDTLRPLDNLDPLDNNHQELFEQAIDQPKLSKKPIQYYFKKVIHSLVGAIIGTLAIAIVLRYLDPPMIHQNSKNKIEKSPISWKKFILWLLLVFIIILSSPTIIRLFRKKST